MFGSGWGSCMGGSNFVVGVDYFYGALVLFWLFCVELYQYVAGWGIGIMSFVPTKMRGTLFVWFQM